MGQQQLLLLVLGIVIVGLAVVVGINAFTENQHKSDVDRYTALGVGLAGDIIAYHQKPTAMGGGGQVAASLGSLTVSDLGYAQTGSDTYAGYNRTGMSNGGIIRHLMQSTTHPVWHIHKDPLATGDTRVEVYVFGPHEECVVSRSDIMNVSATWSDGGNDATPPSNPNASLCTW